MTATEITRMLWLYSSPEVRRTRRNLLSAVAGWANLHRDTLHEARRGKPMSERVRTALSGVITMIEKRGIYFRQTGHEWVAHERPPLPHLPPIASALPSPADSKTIPRLVGKTVFNIIHGA
jgi:hypothetical protein